MPASDGAGVRLHRSLGSPSLPLLDPFLLLDEMRSDEAGDYVAGFPDHPHRGFETVTYMLAGRMRHEDHAGNAGDLGPGSLQWMTAGRGIIHSEMPQQEDGLLWGFQMWVNLPRDQKMRAPRYQDIPAGRVPEVRLESGGVVRVLAGTAHGHTGPVEGIVTAPLLLDVRLPAGSSLTEPVPRGHNAFAYVFDEGPGLFGASDSEPGTAAGVRHAVVFGDGDEIRVHARDAGVRFLLAAARPIGEPVARYGPFVMTTREELVQAFADYESGRLMG
jgi:quercetin 2,3-dioxygenase